MNIGFISLGCAKNLVDSEMILGILKQAGCQIVNDPEDADAIFINTCGFIESAKNETIDTIN
jgi:ribosomal protein S12 methylthiotransferase